MEMVRLGVCRYCGDHHCRRYPRDCTQFGPVPGAAPGLSCACHCPAVDWEWPVRSGTTARSTLEESQVNTMSDQRVSTLVPSTSRGRYALDDPVHGQDVTAGNVLQVLLGGHWIRGSIEHASGLYALEPAAH